MVDYDIVICGAGISGLLLASQLSKYCSVLVLEKSHQSECSNKFWLTRDGVLHSNPKLGDCVDSKWHSMDFISNRGARCSVKGKYVLWNTQRLENFLINEIQNNGALIRYNSRFYKYEYANGCIVSYANEFQFSSKLLVDCMGHSSPIVCSSNAVDVYGYYHLYGRTMALKRPLNPIAIDNVLLSGKPSYMEVFPRADNTANVVLIAPARTTTSLPELQSDFEFIVQNSHYSKYLYSTHHTEPLYGVVPVGDLRKPALERILFYGEAGQIHPAASCTCLDKILSGYQSVSDDICSKLRSDALSAKDLRCVVPRMSRFSRKFHLNLFNDLADWTSSQGEEFAELLNCLDQQTLDDLIFGEITPSHFAQLDNLKNILRTGNAIWVKPFLKTLINL